MYRPYVLWVSKSSMYIIWLLTNITEWVLNALSRCYIKPVFHLGFITYVCMRVLSRTSCKKRQARHSLLETNLIWKIMKYHWNNAVKPWKNVRLFMNLFPPCLTIMNSINNVGLYTLPALYFMCQSLDIIIYNAFICVSCNLNINVCAADMGTTVRTRHSKQPSE